MLDLIRQKYPEYHPVVAMADLAHTTDNEEIEFKCHQSIAKFVLPELKSIEVRAQISEQRRVIVELFDESMMPSIDKPKAPEILAMELDQSNDSVVDATELIRQGVRHVLEESDGNG
jgi:hypothetical protein